MDIIVYDFDKTIYGGETGTDFLVFYMKKNPKKIFLFSIGFVKDALLFLFKKIKLKELKGRYFKFLSTYSVLRYLESNPVKSISTTITMSILFLWA